MGGLFLNLLILEEVEIKVSNFPKEFRCENNRSLFLCGNLGKEREALPLVSSGEVAHA